MRKGFTLIELLIVIAILAVLATVVVLVLNPAQLLAEARDAQRLQDLSTLQDALNFYLIRTASPSLPSTSNCYSHQTGLAANCGGRHTGKTSTLSASRVVTGTGWIPVNLSSLSPSPIANLPIDPTNSTTYFYSYVSDSNLTFELNANMESTRYATGGGDDKESNTEDGGSSDTIYEIGTAPGLAN